MDNNSSLYSSFLIQFIQAEGSRNPCDASSEVDRISHFIGIAEHGLIALKRKRNSLLFINTLPAEILTAIFEWAIRDDIRKRYVELQRFRFVSTAWRDAIDNTPVLWSVLSSQHSWRTLDIALKRSSNHPLEVWHSPPQGLRTTEISRLLGSSSMSRWKVASLQFSSALSVCQLDQPAPLLEVLHLRVPTLENQTYELKTLFRQRMPRLKELSLESVAVPWNSPYLRCLQILDLRTIRRHGPSISQLLSIISNCPKLSTVILKAVVFAPESSTDQKSIRLTMPHLSHLQLTNLAAASAHQIITYLGLPTLSKFKLTSHLSRDNTSHLFNPKLDSRVDAFSRLLQNANTLKIQLSTDSFICGAAFPRKWNSPTTQEFTVTLRNGSPAGPLRWLVGILKGVSNPPSVEVAFTDDIPFARDEELFHNLLEIPHVIDISFNYPTTDTRLLLEALGTARLGEDGVTRWPLPTLILLCLCGENFHASDVLKMVESRYGMSDYKHVPDEHLPVPFVLLNVTENSSLTDDMLCNIQHIVGQRVLEWDDYGETPTVFDDLMSLT